jgi:hypothetical protein
MKVDRRKVWRGATYIKPAKKMMYNEKEVLTNRDNHSKTTPKCRKDRMKNETNYNIDPIPTKIREGRGNEEILETKD